MKDLEKRIEELIIDCLMTGEAERKASKVMYGDPKYWVKQIMILFKKEWLKIVGEDEKPIHENGVTHYSTFGDVINEYKKELRDKIKDK